MNSNYKYLVNERAQLFIKVDNEKSQINYQSSLASIKSAGINSVQIFADEIADITVVNKINEIVNLEIDNTVLNIKGIKENMIDMLSDKISCFSLTLTEESIKERLSIMDKLKTKNKYVGINLEITTSEEWTGIVRIIIDKYKPSYIILDPIYMKNDVPNLSLYEKKFATFKDKIKEFSVPIYMTIGIYYKGFLMDHPCNIYLCSGGSCHTGKGSKVRRLCIDLDGDVLPESFEFNKIYKLGNIKERNILSIINESDSKGYDASFLNLCKTLYQNIVIPSSSKVIPWIKLLTFWSNCNKSILKRVSERV